MAKSASVYDLKKLYNEQVKSELKKEFNYSNDLEIPKLKKITLNMSVPDAIADSKVIDSVVSELSDIAGQAAVKTYAHKSLASFKIRKGMPIGCKVTLRNKNMWNFLQKFIFTALPRARDFKGMNFKSFDKKGNFNFGIKEHTIFLEIDYNKISKIRGLDVSFETSAKNDKEAKSLLEKLHIPFYN